jgi:hypothetical protein
VVPENIPEKIPLSVKPPSIGEAHFCVAKRGSEIVKSSHENENEGILEGVIN